MYVIPGHVVVSSSTATFTINRVRYFPIFIDTVTTFDQLLAEVTVAGLAGETFRAALYNADADLQPTTLIQDFGTLPADAVALISYTVDLTLPPGRYLLALNTNSATATLREMRTAHLFTDDLAANMGINQYFVAQAYGAFPDPGAQWSSIGQDTGTGLRHFFVWRPV